LRRTMGASGAEKVRSEFRFDSFRENLGEIIRRASSSA